MAKLVGTEVDMLGNKLGGLPTAVAPTDALPLGQAQALIGGPYAPKVHASIVSSDYGVGDGTSFGHLRIGTENPTMNGAASPGSLTGGAVASFNHIHPTDTSRAATVHTNATGASIGQASATVFGHAKAATVAPVAASTASVGTDDGLYARANHRHPEATTARTPTAHTNAAVGSIGGATTALYGHTKAATTLPVMNGTAYAGNTVDIFAQSNHVHPGAPVFLIRFWADFVAFLTCPDKVAYAEWAPAISLDDGIQSPAVPTTITISVSGAQRILLPCPLYRIATYDTLVIESANDSTIYAYGVTRWFPGAASGPAAAEVSMEGYCTLYSLQDSGEPQ